MNAQKKHVRVAVGVILNDQQQVLVARRAKHKHQGGLWEFPGGKIEQGEGVEQALSRELKEELNIQVRQCQAFTEITHEYEDLRVSLMVWTVTDFGGHAVGHEGQDVQWIALSDLPKIKFPAANRAIVAKLLLPQRVAISGALDSLASVEAWLQRVKQQGLRMLVLRPSRDGVVVPGEWIDRVESFCRSEQVFFQLSSKMAYQVSQGLHLAASDLLRLQARPESLPGWLGASCHSLEECLHAERIGCDYVFLSPVSTTRSHPEAKPIGFESFAQLAAQISVPVFALGGMQESDMPAILQAGGHGYAAISAFC